MKDMVDDSTPLVNDEPSFKAAFPHIKVVCYQYSSVNKVAYKSNNIFQPIVTAKVREGVNKKYIISKRGGGGTTLFFFLKCKKKITLKTRSNYFIAKL